MKLIMTKGLPGSGKSTWAKELIQKEPGRWKRINKDDLRLMLDNSKWSKQNEQFVILMRDTMALSALEKGWNVIIDDTNLHPKHELHLKELAKERGADFEVKDFTDVPLEVCIERDLKRTNSVGKKVIVGMYKQFLRKIPIIINDPKLPNAIICDIDGTLAHLNGRNPFDASTCEKDLLNKPIAYIITLYRYDAVTKPKIILCSGREDKYREQTEAWLYTNAIKYDHLFMRKTADARKDSIMKKEIYDNEIKEKYNILFVLDDRNQVVDMWRSLGLTCLQVAEGDF